MNRGAGWGNPEMVVGAVEPFTKEQRQRLEALTFARRLVSDKDANPLNPSTHVSEMLRVGEYIVNGSRT